MAKKVVVIIDNKIKNITNNLILIDTEFSNYLENKLEIFKDNQQPKDSLELVDTLDIFLTSMTNKDKNKLKDILTNNKSDRVKLNIFLKEFNKVSPFTQLNSEQIIKQIFKTAGGGKPDTVIIRTLDNGEYKFFYSAASHSPDAPLEDMQLFVQPLKLKEAIDEVKTIIDKTTSLEEVNSLLVSKYNKQELTYSKSNTYNIFKYIEDNLDDIIADEIDFFKDLEINGTFSHPDIKVVKNSNLQREIYNQLEEEEIQKRSQWLFIVGQLTTGYDKINLYAEYSEEDKKRHKSNLTKVIDKVLSKITYPNQTLLKQEPIQEVKKETFLTKVSGFIQGKKEEEIEFNNMDTVFDEEFLSEESIIEFLDLIIDKTKPYTFEKGKKKNKKTVTEKQSVLNTQKIIKSFALSSSYISDKFNGNKEIQNKLQEITRITGLTTIDLINQAKQDKNQEAVEESLELLKMLDTDKYIHILLESKDNDVYIKKHLEDLIRMNSAFEGHIESLENESKKKDNNITSIQDNYEKRLIISINDILPTDIDTKEVQKDKIKDFSTKFNYIMTEMKLSQLDFLRIMEEVDEIPNSIKEKKDIETIIEIFENLHSILELTIEDKFMRDIFNEILKNSLELKTLDYKEFVEVLVEEIVKKYNEDNNKFYISEILKRLKENLSIKDLNEEKKKLSLVIIKKADSIIKEEKKLKEESEPNIKGSKKSGSAAKQ